MVFALPRILAQRGARRGQAPRPATASRRQYGIGVPLVSALALPRRAHAFVPALALSSQPGTAAGNRRRRRKKFEYTRSGVEAEGDCGRRAARRAERRPKLYDNAVREISTGNGQAVWSSQHGRRGRFCRPSVASVEKDAQVPQPRPSILAVGIETTTAQDKLVGCRDERAAGAVGPMGYRWVTGRMKN